MLLFTVKTKKKNVKAYMCKCIRYILHTIFHLLSNMHIKQALTLDKNSRGRFHCTCDDLPCPILSWEAFLCPPVPKYFLSTKRTQSHPLDTFHLSLSRTSTVYTNSWQAHTSPLALLAGDPPLRGVVLRESLFADVPSQQFPNHKDTHLALFCRDHYHNRAAEDRYSIRAREPGNTKHASFRLYGDLLYLMVLSIYHITNVLALSRSCRNTLFYFCPAEVWGGLVHMSYNHICMQHHMSEADGRGGL